MKAENLPCYLGLLFPPNFPALLHGVVYGVGIIPNAELYIRQQRDLALKGNAPVVVHRLVVNAIAGFCLV